jgi:predicted ATP-dependent serine protease
MSHYDCSNCGSTLGLFWGECTNCTPKEYLMLKEEGKKIKAAAEKSFNEHIINYKLKYIENYYVDNGYFELNERMEKLEALHKKKHY